ncbi:MAG TPA: LLM class flavin-dependent oxidoreductase [Acidimicrobiia bacterium]|nr:LLM class flavin-dependent oxidoreductase [Acidimicrobiia bacterium]
MTRVGITLPSFREDPDIPIAVAVAADAAGLDGVFAYDHLFRVARDGTRRPALECTTLLAATAVETERVELGTLALRASLRPAATLAVALDTLQRIAGPRLVATIGAGDGESRQENESYGLGFGTLTGRVERLGATTAALAGRGYPVWVGGSARHVGAVAARADGWNRWGVDPATFATELASVRGLAVEAHRAPEAITPSWGGLVVLAATDRQAEEKAGRLDAGPDVLVGGVDRLVAGLGAYVDAGADWVIVGPLDSSDPENATRLGEVVSRLADRSPRDGDSGAGAAPPR